MIQNSEFMLDELSKHFNARLIPKDFTDNLPLLADILNGKLPPPEMRHCLKLPLGEEKVFRQLISFGYPELIGNIIKRVQIETESYDNFRSEMSYETVEWYKEVVFQLAKVVDIEVSEPDRMIYIVCPEILVELLWCPLSQFHTSVLSQLEHFNRFNDIFAIYADTSDSPPNLFVNSKAPTSFSYFIIAYIAENLNIPLSI
ncbi:MAG: hypothetical protein JNK79_13115 [Chitinophagaceae bacterium]|nr:hypothetical protein [Chitinophagaceae bacterium]